MSALTVFLAALLLLAVAWGAWFAWRRAVDRDLDEGARAEFARLSDLEARAADARREAAFLTGLPEDEAVETLAWLRDAFWTALPRTKTLARLDKVADREAFLGFATSPEAADLDTDAALQVRAERLAGGARADAVRLVHAVRERVRAEVDVFGALAARVPGVDLDTHLDAIVSFALGRRLTVAMTKPLLRGMDEDAFRAVYARVETPRFPAYALVATTAFVLGTPLVMGVLSAFSFLFTPQDVGRAALQLQMGEGGTASMANRVSTEELQYILQGWSGFYYFFGLLAFWILTLIVVLRRYHARTPGLLREEVLRSR